MTLLEVMIAGAFLGIAVLAFGHSLAWASLLQQRATRYWNDEIDKWNRVVETRIAGAPQGTPFEVPGAPRLLYRVQVAPPDSRTGRTWEVFLAEK